MCPRLLHLLAQGNFNAARAALQEAREQVKSDPSLPLTDGQLDDLDSAISEMPAAAAQVASEGGKEGR